MKKFKNLTREKTFEHIHSLNHWGSKESVSGSGSEKKTTKEVLNIINQVIEDYNIHSILDIPCGDFNWIGDSRVMEIEYIGADIVHEIVKSNNNKFSGVANLNFIHSDIVTSKLPKVDLVFTRDCLVHLSNVEVNLALDNIAKSNSTYLLTTSFTKKIRRNKDIITGAWRPINLLKKPFCLPEPLAIFNEKCTENNNRFRDKSLLLFEISSIAASFKEKF